MFQLWLSGFLVVLIFLVLLWILSVIIKNASIIDPFWGTGFVILITYYIFDTQNLNPETQLLWILTTVWGLRLSLFLLKRNWGKGEDYRYQQFRKDYGEKRYWWFSFFQVFLLQGVLMSIVALPLLGTVMNSHTDHLGPGDYLVIVIWLIGFIFEAVGDFQLEQFKKNRKDKSEVLRTGLWKYTRHPNYFGNAMIWLAFGIMAIINGSYFTFIGTVVMIYLLLKVSGVSLLERTLKTSKPEYADYASKTSAFIPWFPKK